MQLLILHPSPNIQYTSLWFKRAQREFSFGKYTFVTAGIHYAERAYVRAKGPLIFYTRVRLGTPLEIYACVHTYPIWNKALLRTSVCVFVAFNKCVFIQIWFVAVGLFKWMGFSMIFLFSMSFMYSFFSF